jgi:hypothetical protein
MAFLAGFAETSGVAFARGFDTLSGLGVWRSLVARSVRVGEVPSSNLGTPINMGETMFPP